MTLVFAHRGSVQPGDARSPIRENSLDAFRRAAELRADGVELDVRRTTDGWLVLHHDAVVVAEASGRPGQRIETSVRSDLPEWLPTLEDALVVCHDLGLVVNVEVKSELDGPSHDPLERCALDTASVCGGVEGADGWIVVSSFSTSALLAVRQTAHPNLPLAWLFAPLAPVGSVSAANSEGTLRHGGRQEMLAWDNIALGLSGRGGLAVLQQLGLEGLHPYSRLVDKESVGLVDKEFVGASHERGLAVRTSTVDRPERIVALAEAGVDAVITNDVTTARVALGSRGR